MSHAVLLAVTLASSGCAHPMTCGRGLEPVVRIAPAPCPPEPVLEVADLQARYAQLVGTTVTVGGPLRIQHPWCTDCCTELGGMLAIGDGTSVALTPWTCAQRDGHTDCALPPDGHRVVVRGTVAAGDAAQLRNPVLCEAR